MAFIAASFNAEVIRFPASTSSKTKPKKQQQQNKKPNNNNKNNNNTNMTTNKNVFILWNLYEVKIII